MKNSAGIVEDVTLSVIGKKNRRVCRIANRAIIQCGFRLAVRHRQ